jgi:hypothetical protein
VPEHRGRAHGRLAVLEGECRLTQQAAHRGHRARGHGLAAVEAEVAARFDTPLRVPVTAASSERDGVVAWQACIDPWSPQVRHVEVRETHLGLGLAPRVLAVVADALQAH